MDVETSSEVMEYICVLLGWLLIREMVGKGQSRRLGVELLRGNESMR